MSIIDIISLLPLAYLAVITLPLVVIDYEQHRLPNKIVLPFVATSFLSVLVVNIANQSWLNLLLAVGIPLAVFILGMFLNYYGYIGMGDIKLLLGVMLAVSLYSPVASLLIIPIALGFALIEITYRVIMKQQIYSIPLGPWVILSTLIVGTSVVVPAMAAW
jgi:leader peptidase (prepilin peptidase)/N-methyltransferase